MYNHEFASGSNIRIMTDEHAKAGDDVRSYYSAIIIVCQDGDSPFVSKIKAI